MNLSLSAYECCELCPRRCGIDRSSGELGVCGQGSAPRAARAALHMWEEPPISGEEGSGTIFFVGCPLRCRYCQNIDISRSRATDADVPGSELDAERLARTMVSLEAQGALNVNLVTGLHFAPHIVEAVRIARGQGLSIPIVANSSGYELAELVRALRDTVDVWLADFKYADASLARELSAAPDYPEVATEALAAMMEGLREKGGRLLGDDGRMLRGAIVRHLVLPGHADDSCAVLDRVWDICGNDADLSVMNQYTPNAAMRAAGGDLSRPVTQEEYELVLDHADELGFERMWWQEGGTVSESFVPAFDGEGID